MPLCTISRWIKEAHMGDKGGRKDKDKSQKQKTMKHVHEMQQKRDNQAKSTLEGKNRI
jgi:hypothetical protein